MKSSAPQRSQNAVRQRALRISPIAAACSTLMFAMGAAYAQDASLDTVTVTGIRHAIETSIAAKRNSDSIVEVVSSEDIGKLPDTSIADAIARLPGLAAQRVDGRPSAISIRGLGPDYSGALLNGRQVVSSGDGRAAEYDQFPSELVSQVIVYKTPDAALIGQGLSGTIDIRPLMPLDLRGQQVVLNVRGEQNSNGKLSPDGNGALGNRVSASYVNQFADYTIGLALGFAHLDTPGQEKKYEAWRYGDYLQWSQGTATGVPTVGVAVDHAAFIQGFEASVTSSKQVRDGLMGVLEFKPNKDLHSVVDLYYSKFTQDRVEHHWVGDLGVWSGGANFANVGTSVVNGDTIVSSGTAANGRSLVYDKTFHRTDEITSLGWKNELKLADKWTAVADLGYSRANRDEKYIQSVAKPVAGGTFTFSGLNSTTNPSWATNQDLTAVQLTNDPNWAEMKAPKYTDEIKSARLAGKRDLDWGVVSKIEAGVGYNQRDKNVQMGEYLLSLASTNVAIPASAIRPSVPINIGGINTSIAAWDVPSIMGLYTATAKNPWDAKDNHYGVHEKITTAFVKLDVDSSLGEVPMRGNVGVQAVHSQQNSNGFAWNDGGTAGAPSAGALVAVNEGTSYNDFLPSLNLAFNLKSDLIARLGLAKTMARPRMDDMRAGSDQPKLSPISPGSTVGTWSANGGGKPDLQPWRAKALDLSLEQYIGKSSYVAGAAFYKALDSFIYQQDTLRDFSGATNYSPTLTPGCSPTQPNCNPNLGTINTQSNGQGGKVYGLELSTSLEASLLTPLLKGFGVIASESVTRNSLPKDKNGNKIYLDGFSGIVNSLALYYEQYGFSTRISQRYRSPFTATTRSLLLNLETNTHIDAERQLDFQMGYAFESGSYKGLSILLQVNNLTNASAVQQRNAEIIGATGSSTGLLPWKVDNFGRSVLVGASYKF